MNLSDTITVLQANVDLVHEFAKGDKDVTVHGDKGSYPSLAKIAADSKIAVDSVIEECKEVIIQNKVDISGLIEEYEEQLDVSQAALVASNEALAALFRQASGIVGKTYKFASTKELHITHGMRTKIFSATFIASDGARLEGVPIDVVDENKFIVEFADYEEGSLSVIFHLNTDSPTDS